MYTMTHNGNVLFDPRDSARLLEAPVLSREVNKLATMDFTIYPGNPEFDAIQERTSRLNVYRDGALVTRLRPVYRKNTFAGGVTWRCEELAATLDDVLHRPDWFKGTISAYLARMIDAYNDLVPAAMAVTLGNVRYKASQKDTFVNDDYEGFWEGMVSHVVDVYGGYLVPRYEENAIYIDYLSDEHLPQSGQSIRFGENMADMFLETESGDVFSVLIPLGPDEDVSNPKEGQARQRPMTISSVNNGKDYLESAAGIALYGRREKTQQWKSATSASDLKSKGQAFLNENAVKLKRSVTLSAIDLHYLDADTSAIDWMTRLSVYSEAHGVDDTYTVTRLDLQLGEPEPIKIQLGEPKIVLTDRLPKNSTSKRRSGGGGGGGGGGGRAASEEEVSHWEAIVTKHNEMLIDTGVQEVWTSGIVMDAETGLRMFSLYDALTHASGEIQVSAGQIAQIVSAVGADGRVTAASIVLAINNNTSSIKISADRINLDGYVTTSMLEAAFTDADQIACNQLTVSSYLTVGAHNASWQDKEVGTSLSVTHAGYDTYVTTSSTKGANFVTGVSLNKTRIYYLGR